MNPYVVFSQMDISQEAVTPEATIRLMHETVHVDGDSSPTLMGLEFRMQPGWKIYWTTPGAGGRPPEIHWQERSRNIENIDIQWPFPVRFRTLGLLSNGYKDHVVLPIWVSRQNTERPLTFDAVVKYFICKDICIPGEVRLGVSIPFGERDLTPDAKILNTALQKVPAEWPKSLEILSTEALLGHDNQNKSTVVLRSRVPLKEVDVFFDGEGEFQQPFLYFNENRTEVRIQTSSHNLVSETIDLVVRAIADTDEIVYARTTISEISQAGIAWIWVLLVALTGGLLINVMPCVLPVLSLKVFGALSGGSVHNARVGFLIMSAGMIGAFTLLGLAFAVLRTSGHALHWGMQFQQPFFLAAMIFVLVFLAAILLDWWHVRLPHFINFSGTKLHNRHFQEFMTGIIATVLATPCSAPLVGVTISLAFFVDTLSMIIILTTMGLGMAAPYLLLAASPKLLYWLPKPGAWMFLVKKILALGVLCTVIWVLWLLTKQIGLVGAGSMAFMASLIFFSLWMVKFPNTKIAPYRGKLAMLIVLFAFLMLPRFAPEDYEESLGKNWQPFMPEMIAEHLENGKSVLVDVTADWCLSCIVNDQLVLNQQEVLDWRGSANVIAMRGDWSRSDEKIRQFLLRFDRQALPFAILFTPHSPEGLLLPELLSMNNFVAAIKRTQAAPLTPS